MLIQTQCSVSLVGLEHEQEPAFSNKLAEEDEVAEGEERMRGRVRQRGGEEGRNPVAVSIQSRFSKAL